MTIVILCCQVLTPVHESQFDVTDRKQKGMLCTLREGVRLACVFKEWVNNCWWGWQNRTALEKCTHQYEDTQGTIKNTSTFDNEDSVLKALVLLIVLCVSWYRRVHFSRLLCFVCVLSFSPFIYAHWERMLDFSAFCPPPPHVSEAWQCSIKTALHKGKKSLWTLQIK